MCDFLEKDLEDIIWEADPRELRERGLYIKSNPLIKKFRQLRIGNYGVADLVYVSKKPFEIFEGSSVNIEGCRAKSINIEHPKLIITICELKKGPIDVDTFKQGIRYAAGIRSYLENVREFFDFELRVKLIGRKIALNDDLVFAADVFNNVSLYHYNYDINGIRFINYVGYVLMDEGFKK